MRILHNPRCSKSRQTLALIEQAGIQPEVVLYLEATPTVSELDEILTKLGLEPVELMRRGEAIYKELGLAGRDLARHEAIELMVKHPVLIERPIVIHGDRAVLGRPPENVQELL
jgi:arsenate reductase